MKRFGDILAVIGIPLVALGTFFGLWHVYFQQDEWSGFGKVLYANIYGLSSIIRLSGNHFTPLTALTLDILYNTFGLNYIWYGVYGIILHSVNSLLVYVLARIMFKKRLIAFVTALLFASAHAGSQAISWYAASMSFLPSGFFALLGLIAFERYLETKRLGAVLGAIGSVLIASGFRENAIVILGYMVIRAYLIDSKSAKRLIVFAAGAGCLYGLFRIFPFLTHMTTIATSTPYQRDVLTQGINALVIWMPQLLIPRDMGISLGYALIGDGKLWNMINYIMDVTIFMNSVFVPMYSVITGFMIGIFLWLFAKKELPKRKARMALLSLGSFVVLAVLPFALLPTGLFMESRHFYLATIGFVLLAGFIIKHIWEGHSRILRSVIVCAVVVFVGINIYFTRQEIERQTTISRVRRVLVTTIISTYPHIPKRVIFYGQGNPLPFQSGTGYMLMMLLSGKQQYQSFLYENFLWNLGSVGYREKDGTGFGYLTDREQLLDFYCRSGFTPEEVFSFSWDEEKKRFWDVTTNVRARLTCSSVVQ